MVWDLGRVVEQGGASEITDLVFSDNAVIFAESLEVLVMALETLYEVKPLELKVSWAKTKAYLMKQYSLSMRVERTLGF